ncbi:MAG: hypothetical protein HYX60_11660 [Legionella longbeachae]|nr:hypothetical protein [Legionella longbeachae]
MEGKKSIDLPGMVAHLLNIDNELATNVAPGLGLKKLSKPCEAAKPTLELSSSDKLCILKNNPNTLKGRHVGIMLGELADSILYHSLVQKIAKERLYLGTTLGKKFTNWNLGQNQTNGKEQESTIRNSID